MRHVDKKKQSREIKKGEEVQEHKHEGETVNLEVRATKTRIEFRAGNDVVELRQIWKEVGISR